jgi:hypothetical protein
MNVSNKAVKLDRRPELSVRQKRRQPDCHCRSSMFRMTVYRRLQDGASKRQTADPARALGVDPIERPVERMVETLLHNPRDRSESLANEQLLAQRLDQSLALFNNQVGDNAPPILTLLCDPLPQLMFDLRRNPLVERQVSLAAEAQWLAVPLEAKSEERFGRQGIPGHHGAPGGCPD